MIKIFYVSQKKYFYDFCYENHCVNVEYIHIDSVYKLHGIRANAYILHYSSELLRDIELIKKVIPGRKL